MTDTTELASASNDKPLQEKSGNKEEWDQRLPAWQRSVNAFCENWIFAFAVAMIIRAFFFEAYRIPSASMEPTLYGDKAFMEGDFVVVSKTKHFFSLPDRWDVVVFHYPKPEVQSATGAAIPAENERGKRIDNVFSQPLMHRNFVKRCVLFPGDEFYVSGGDVYLKQEQGNFAVVQKPEDVQEALWTSVYEHGAQDGYVPWKGDGTAQVESDNGLSFSLKGGQVTFTQPFINLYFKPGTVKVASARSSAAARQALRDLDAGNPAAATKLHGEQVKLSMLQPLFEINGQKGNVWDMASDDWIVSRLTTDDLDRNYGAVLNRRMNEYVGDVRVRFTPTSISGTVVCTIEEGNLQAFHLTLTESSWAISNAGNEVVAKGTDALLDEELEFIHVDNRVWFAIDGEPLCEPIVSLASQPHKDRTHVLWSGQGTIALEECSVDRDVHYCRNGFLVNDPARGSWQERALREQVYGLSRNTIKIGDKQGMLATAYSAATAQTVPDKAYGFLGDNSPFSFDSRGWGWVPEANLRGEVMAVVMPPSRIKVVE